MTIIMFIFFRQSDFWLVYSDDVVKNFDDDYGRYQALKSTVICVIYQWCGYTHKTVCWRLAQNV